MRKIMLLFSLFSGIFGCQSKKTLEDKSFLPGKYVRYADVGVRKSFDTLVIRLIDGNNFAIEKFSTFQKILDGQALPWQHTHEQWMAVYDEPTHLLNETVKGKTLIIDQRNSTLLLGTNEFKKVPQ